MPDRHGGRRRRHAERRAGRRRAAGVDRRRADRRAGRHARGAGRRACAALVADPERRDELGEAAPRRGRAASPGTHTAEAQPGGAGARGRGRRARGCATPLARSETGKAAGLAGATLANNAVQLVFTSSSRACSAPTATARWPRSSRAFLILMVGGQSIQVAAARETTLGHLGDAEAPARDAARLDAPAASAASRVTAASIAAARAARRPARRARAPVGGGGDPADRRAVAAAVAAARRAAGPARLPAASASRSSARPVGRHRLRPRPRRASALGVTGAFLGHAAGLRRRVAVARLRAARPPRAGRARAEHARTLRSLIGDDWVPIARPAAARRAAERRRDRGQARVRRRRGGLLRGGRRRRQVRRVGGDRRRPAAAARGDAPRRRRARPAAGAAARARGPGRRRGAGAAHLRRRPRAAAADRLRARPDRGRRRAAGPRRRR